jgi:hypothetical protein
VDKKNTPPGEASFSNKGSAKTMTEKVISMVVNEFQEKKTL